MNYLAKYKKSDFKRISWSEYGKTLEKIYKKLNRYIEKNNIKIDAVVPILRGGAFPGTYLAYKLHLLQILPIQYHYLFINKRIELRKILDFPKKELKLPKNPTFLLVENNHCFGVTVSNAAKDLKRAFPKCRIIYVADHIDYSYQKIDNTETIIYGVLTNETRALTKKECEKIGIKNISYLFPWEIIDEEWTTVQAKQFKYKDLQRIKDSSKLKKLILND